MFRLVTFSMLFNFSIFIAFTQNLSAQDTQKVKSPPKKLGNIDGSRGGSVGGGSRKTGIIWIKIKGGEFWMGGAYSDFDNERPVHRREVGDFYMSKTEVTVGEYRKCVKAGICSEPDGKDIGDLCNWGYSDRDQHPINCVDWKQARVFAKWVGGDLPSEAQWEYAARSRGKNIEYPWGNAKATCKYAVMGNPSDLQDESSWGCGRQESWKVCSKTRGNTEQGLCDMAGNVLEWVLDEWRDSYWLDSSCRGSTCGEVQTNDIGWCSNRDCSTPQDVFVTRISRGGCWNSNNLGLRTAFRSEYSSNSRWANIGFRVSKSIP